MSLAFQSKTLQTIVPQGQTSLLGACWLQLRRDLRLSFRRKAELFNPLLFFVMVVSLFPLGVSPEPAFLARAGAGVTWVAALLATLLSLDQVFRHDFDDGALDQLLLTPQPLYFLVLTKVLGHWLVSGLPLLLLSPVLAIMLHLQGNQIQVLCLGLLLGTPILSLLGTIGAALTVSLRGGGVLLSLLLLPLYVPVLIFGTGAVIAVTEGGVVGGYLALLGAMLAASLVLTPFATAAALKISSI